MATQRARSSRVTGALGVVLLVACGSQGDSDEKSGGAGGSPSSGAGGSGAEGGSGASFSGNGGDTSGSGAVSGASSGGNGTECPADGVEKRTSVTQYGITWTFEESVLSGQFVTGDYWVLGPVTVESVSPLPTGERNGSMLDPVDGQAYDGRAGRFEADAAVSFPVRIAAGHSLVSSVSHPEEAECKTGSADGWLTYDGSCQRGPIETQAILTVLDEEPPCDAFRPGYSQHGAEIYRAADVCWSALPRVEAPNETPPAGEMLRHIERPWIDHLNSWTMQHGCATQNMFCYGREIGQIVSELAAYILTDAPQHEEVALRLIQLGIDNYAVLQAGGGWGGDGGHFNGRKWPIVLAGGLLGNAAMASPGTEIGNEDRMTYYGGDDVARWGRDCDSCYFENACSYGGACSSGAKDCRDPAGAADGCQDYRNCCTSHTWVGEALSARLLGLDDEWAHPAFFAYVDRWMAGNVEGSDGSKSDFVDAMWAAHRSTAPVQDCP